MQHNENIKDLYSTIEEHYISDPSPNAWNQVKKRVQTSKGIKTLRLFLLTGSIAASLLLISGALFLFKSENQSGQKYTHNLNQELQIIELLPSVDQDESLYNLRQIAELEAAYKSLGLNRKGSN